MKYCKRTILLVFFLIIGNFVSANELNNFFRQLIINRVAKSSPDAGRLLQVIVKPKPNVYVAPNSVIQVGQNNYGNHSPVAEMYPEPKTARDYVVYGKLLGNVGKIQDAMKYFLIARNMEPDNPEARYGLAFSLALLGDKSRAREEYNALYLRILSQYHD